jgi:hypothetical protein
MKDNPDIRLNLDTELRKALGLVKGEPVAAPAESPMPVAAAAGKPAPPRR